MSAQTPPAGWHPDPQGPPGQTRYWDGQQWTDHTAPAPSQAVGSRGQFTKPTKKLDGLVAGGIAGAILFPVVGFVIGVILLVKGRGAEGAGVLLLSSAVTFIVAGQLL